MVISCVILLLEEIYDELNPVLFSIINQKEYHRRIVKDTLLSENPNIVLGIPFQ